MLVNGDTKYEPNETFTLNLSDPLGATLARNVATGTIRNDDPKPKTLGTDASVQEIAGTTSAALAAREAAIAAAYSSAAIPDDSPVEDDEAAFATYPTASASALGPLAETSAVGQTSFAVNRFIPQGVGFHKPLDGRATSAGASLSASSKKARDVIFSGLESDLLLDWCER